MQVPREDAAVEWFGGEKMVFLVLFSRKRCEGGWGKEVFSVRFGCLINSMGSKKWLLKGHCQRCISEGKDKADPMCSVRLGFMFVDIEPLWFSYTQKPKKVSLTAGFLPH